VLLVICGSDDIRPIIYVPYVYLVKLIYFIFFLRCYRLWWNKDEYYAYWTVRLLFKISPTRPNLPKFLFHFIYCMRSGESIQYAWCMIKVLSAWNIFHGIFIDISEYYWTCAMMLYCKLYILVRLTMLERTINANGHLFVRVSVPLVSHS